VRLLTGGGTQSTFNRHCTTIGIKGQDHIRPPIPRRQTYQTMTAKGLNLNMTPQNLLQLRSRIQPPRINHSGPFTMQAHPHPPHPVHSHGEHNHTLSNQPSRANLTHPLRRHSCEGSGVSAFGAGKALANKEPFPPTGPSHHQATGAFLSPVITNWVSVLPSGLRTSVVPTTTTSLAPIMSSPSSALSPSGVTPHTSRNWRKLSPG